MKYFGKNYSKLEIEVDPASVTSEDPEMQKRVSRIEQNYSKLDQVLSEFEEQFALDDRLTAQTDTESQTGSNRSKRVRKKKPR